MSIIFTDDSFHLKNNINLTEVTKISYALPIDYWSHSEARLSFWCAILIAHQLLWQNMEAPVSIYQESPLAGEPRDRLFPIHSVHRYQLNQYLYLSTLLWQINVCNL